MYAEQPQDNPYNGLKARLENRLQVLRAEITATLADSAREDYAALAGQVHDRVDESIADLLVDVRNADMERDVAEAQDVETALARLRSGFYGLCQDCGEPIPLNRMNAYPTAKRCWSCQEKHERSRRALPPARL